MMEGGNNKTIKDLKRLKRFTERNKVSTAKVVFN